MQSGRRFLSVVALVASVGFLGACSTGESPTAPDVPGVSGSPNPAQADVPEPGCVIKDITASAVNFASETDWPKVVRVRVANPKGTSCSGIRLTAWNANDQANQIFFADSAERFPGSDELSVEVPCGVRVQLDVNNSPYTPDRGQYSPAYFVKAWWGRGPACTEPTPPPPPPACSDYTPPTITGSPAVAINPTTVTVTAGSVAPTGGSFTPALPLTVERPLYNQPAGSWSTTYNLPYGPAALHCSVSKPFTGPVPPKDPPGDPCEGVGNPSFTFTKSETTNSAVVTSSLTFPGGFTGSIGISPSPVSGFPGGTVTSGASNVSNYNRPDWNQSPLTVNGTWQVRKNETVCKSGAGSVDITPKSRVCGDVNAKVVCEVLGDDAQCTGTWINPGSGSMKLDAGIWQSISNGETLPYRNLTPGTHTAKLKVQDGGLTCEDSVPFIIEGGSVCDNTPATSTAAQPFSLPNSNPVTETNWVNANVNPGPYAFSHKDENGGPSCKPAGSAAKVVLLKAGQNYWYFLNVQVGQQLCSSGQGISHLSYFVCAGQ